ncbi:RagB/SusD family nutrient uptake outer membrane protein [Wenyingzhuangia sp. 2_MG-2023]|uniref:RagB/SusD family nutrient uptake outer membrane protein n=1 Tax=Wenyingzhuangia sp. 2_MG-2023 TaxID=3062639 RepID=UPI0026E188BC|nr:RagB/SusD family nutrient uptake outer membrane protein [Wenyingzhuangia sp. 2_MG-2023]MDO6739288.1 RagB/SusD family nutrient uptake outer membrane protein [Wenyingzhuangia sp. 2_MG-2023]
MKNYNTYIHKAVLLFVLVFNASCDSDFLETPPKDLIEASDFFKTEDQLKAYVNGFYNMLPGQEVYEEDASSDNIIPLLVSDRVRGHRLTPVASGTGGWSWGNLRTINFFLDNIANVNDADLELKYAAYAKFFRAYFYYNKVKTFGDVPWYDSVLSAGDEGLFKARDSRKIVMENVLEDINAAIDELPSEVELNQITKYTALILKARICLFEGTFRKYHNLGDYEFLLEEAASAADELIGSGAYELYNNGNVENSYRELFDVLNQNTTETILARDFNADFITHNIANLATSPTNGSYGVAKDMINSYLLKDGSRFTDIPNYDVIEFYEEMQNRDPRLTQTVAGPNFTVYLEETPEIVNLSGTTTGYRVIKSISTRDQWGNKASVNDIVIFRYAEALLIFAEAKAELGTITQIDLDKSINKLRDRVGMPHLIATEANANPDTYLAEMYPNVESGSNKGVILEIRRERRVEMFMEGLRWDDLMRWKEGKKLEKPFLGIYFSGLGNHDFDNDGNADVYLHDGGASGAAGIPNIINVNERELTNGTSGNFIPFNQTVVFDEDKDYLYPIPAEELILNTNLSQNPNW